MAKEKKPTCSFCGRHIHERTFVEIYSKGDIGELKECDDCIKDFIENQEKNKSLLFFGK